MAAPGMSWVDEWLQINFKSNSLNEIFAQLYYPSWWKNWRAILGCNELNSYMRLSRSSPAEQCTLITNGINCQIGLLILLISFSHSVSPSWLQPLAPSSLNDGINFRDLCTSVSSKSFSLWHIFFFSSLDVSTLARFEPEQYEKLKKTVGEGSISKVYFNKGLWSAWK